MRGWAEGLGMEKPGTVLKVAQWGPAGPERTVDNDAIASSSVKESSTAPSPAVSDPGRRGGVPSRLPQALCRAQVPQRAADDLAGAQPTPSPRRKGF